MLVLPLWCHLLKETSQLACLLFVTLYFTLHRTLINIDAAYSRQHTCLNTKCSRLSWQAEDRAVEANKTVNRLQKDVDRIEGLSVDICTSLVNLSDVEAIRYLKPQPRTVLAPNQYNGSNICLGGGLAPRLYQNLTKNSPIIPISLESGLKDPGSES